MLSRRFDRAVRWRARQIFEEAIKTHVADAHGCLSAQSEDAALLVDGPSSSMWTQYSGEDLYRKYSGFIARRPAFGPGVAIQHDFLQDEMITLVSEIGEHPRFHGKQWQWVSILRQARMVLREASLVGKRPLAVGFGVGTEPIAAVLAKWGFDVIATDFYDGEDAIAWIDTGQMLSSQDKTALNSRNLCLSEVFDQRVTLRNVDMNRIPEDLLDSADFVWSTCALGHIGGYENGLQFVRQSGMVLGPGGVAIHTTEIVVDPSDALDTRGLSLYRLNDLEAVLESMSKDFEIPEHFFSVGHGFLDETLSREPEHFDPHIQIEVLERRILNVSLVAKRARPTP